MNATEGVFSRANYLLRKKTYVQWHQLQRNTQILRSQVGFTDTSATRPKACAGCANYHGISYGTHRGTRILLVCAMHPYGWHSDKPCPDWYNS
ncbi:MAG: hypothetical protein AAFY67_03960 [Cyanobacteria bacterium J06642_9]